MDELLAEPDLDSLSPRLENISRSVTMPKALRLMLGDHSRVAIP